MSEFPLSSVFKDVGVNMASPFMTCPICPIDDDGNVHLESILLKDGTTYLRRDSQGVQVRTRKIDYSDTQLFLKFYCENRHSFYVNFHEHGGTLHMDATDLAPPRQIARTRRTLTDTERQAVTEQEGRRRLEDA
jgi:hypothetical protein